MKNSRYAPRVFLLAILAGFVSSLATPDAQAFTTSGKLLLTGGVTQVEGSAGGGLTPWALIGGYGTKDQVGANASYTTVSTGDYALESGGAMVGLFDRVELSVARQTFNTRDVGAALGLGTDFRLKQNIYGVKVKIIGDAVLEQDSWLPQIAVGIQYKKNEQGDVVRSIKATSDNGTDVYVSATKLILDQSLLLNLTLRATKANQLGILGFGGDNNDSYQPMLEGSLAYLLCSTLAVGGEYRMKPDNLKIAKEENWADLFVAWAPTKNISLTAAYVALGNIVLKEKQRGGYASLQIGF